MYGDSVDKIVQGNTSNIVFLKSTDDSMLDTLEKMSGKTHRVFKDSKTVTRDMEKIWLQNEGKASYTMTTREMPVISYNDMAFISERNSIVFRAGDSPVWNRNETILPMSWRLFKNTIVDPGHDYSLQTIPTLSSALDFDVRSNQPDFEAMLYKRMHQAWASEKAQTWYAKAYGYTNEDGDINAYDIERLDPDAWSDEVMEIINQYMADQKAQETEYDDSFVAEEWEENTEQIAANEEAKATYAVSDTKCFAHNSLAPSDLLYPGGAVNHGLDDVLINAYKDVRGDMEHDANYFSFNNGNLCGVDGRVYIRSVSQSENLAVINKAAHDKNSNVYGEGQIDESELRAIGTFTVTDDFIKFLAKSKSWSFAGGRFDDAVARILAS